MPLMSRRTLLKASAVAGAYGAGLGYPGVFASSPPAPTLLTASTTQAMLNGKQETRDVMTYGSGGMPPVLRMKKGEPFAAKLVNRLDEPTTIHWHGLRIANAMDGVPFLTQPYVYTGDTFDYAFTPPDAGTYWYHPHCNTLTQMGRGLTGVIVVEDKADPSFDAEIVLNLRDWRLGGDGQFIEQFKARDAAKAGTYGTLRTVNWTNEPTYEAPTGGIVRLRMAVTDVTRIFSLTLEGAAATVIALDGNPVPSPFPLDVLMIAPGQRLDLALLMPDTEGAVATLMDIRGSTPKTVAKFSATGASLTRDLRDVGPLAQNPVAEADIASAVEIPLLLSATAEQAAKDGFCGTLGYSFWAINKVPWPGDSADPTAPLFEMKLGKSYILTVSNPTPHSHPIHLHGMSFRAIASSARPVLPVATDTYMILPDEKVQLAVVADNPGDWVFHCHIIEHQKTGMSGYFRVA